MKIQERYPQLWTLEIQEIFSTVATEDTGNILNCGHFRYCRYPPLWTLEILQKSSRVATDETGDILNFGYQRYSRYAQWTLEILEIYSTVDTRDTGRILSTVATVDAIVYGYRIGYLQD